MRNKHFCIVIYHSSLVKAAMKTIYIFIDSRGLGFFYNFFILYYAKKYGEQKIKQIVLFGLKLLTDGTAASNRHAARLGLSSRGRGTRGAARLAPRSAGGTHSHPGMVRRRA
jgi:hypothetical protein